MKRVSFSPRARADLLEIVSYIARDDRRRALSFVAEIEARCADLVHFSDRGRDRSDLQSNLRSIPHGRYLVFYTPGDAEVRIDRILHGARDAGAAFERS